MHCASVGCTGVTGELVARLVQPTSTQLRCRAAVHTPHGKPQRTCSQRESENMKPQHKVHTVLSDVPPTERINFLFHHQSALEPEM